MYCPDVWRCIRTFARPKFNVAALLEEEDKKEDGRALVQEQCPVCAHDEAKYSTLQVSYSHHLCDRWTDGGHADDTETCCAWLCWLSAWLLHLVCADSSRRFAASLVVIAEGADAECRGAGAPRTSSMEVPEMASLVIGGQGWMVNGPPGEDR